MIPVAGICRSCGEIVCDYFEIDICSCGNNDDVEFNFKSERWLLSME